MSKKLDVIDHIQRLVDEHRRQDAKRFALEELSRKRGHRKPECRHPTLKPPAFDERAAEGLDAWEVKKRWPRGHEYCPDCDSTVILYASAMHYIAGDW
jgi:glutaredoxin 2